MGQGHRGNADHRQGNVEVNATLILDTSAVIRLFKGTSREIGRAVAGAARIVIPLAAYAELQSGFERQGAAATMERELFDSLLSTPGASVHHPDERTGVFYAKIFNLLRENGTMIPTNDIWIAAEAMAIGGVLYSSDRHFGSIALLDWRYCE